MQEWAPKRFHLPKSSAISGLINLSLTPYNNQILDDLSPQSPISKIVYICGTQIAKSTIILMAFAYRVDCRIYGDMLYYFPNDGMATKWSKTKLDDTIKANSYLIDAIETGKKKDDNVTFKKTVSGALIISGGKSGSKYRMDTGNFIVADDFAEFPMNVGATKDKTGEGSADKLLEDRGSGTGGTAKVYINSSPKSEKECPAWRSYKLTNQCHYFVTCPKCGTEQAWEFENVEFPHENYELTEEPWIKCQNKECDHRVYEEDKYKIMQNGRWKPTVETKDKLTNGYRMPSVYSLLGYPLKKMAKDWLDACKVFDETGDESEKIRHRNSKQARPWKKSVGKTVEPTALYNTRVSLDPLPEDCAILTAGCDVHGARPMEVQVIGHGEYQTYIVDHIQIAGDINIEMGLEGSPWDALEEFLLEKRYKNIHGSDQPIHAMAIDVGYEKDLVKHFINNADRLYFQKLFGVFGKETATKTINFIQNPTKDFDGFQTWGLSVNIKKKALYKMFEMHLMGKGNLFFSDRPCFTKKWFQQLTIERPDDKGVFKKPHEHAKNEALDCNIYGHAAFSLFFGEKDNVDWEDFKRWNKNGCRTASNTSNLTVISEGVR
jgi:phage terminase large subunit GpA-like protein